MKTPQTPIAPARVNRKHIVHSLILPGLLLGLSQAQVQAAPIFVPNSSFESPILADGEVVFLIPGWTYSGSGAHQAGVYNHIDASFLGATGGNLPAPALGAQSAFLHTGGAAGVGMRTMPLTTILPNTTYTLTAALGVRLDFPSGSGPGQGFAQLNFYADGQPFNAIVDLNINVSTIARGTFIDFSISFTTGATGGIIGQGLYPLIGYNHDGNAGVQVDNVRLDATAIPGPSAAAVLLSVSLLTMNRRRRLTK